jgi:hypothetical protein
MTFSLPTTGFDFSSSLSPSELVDAAKSFSPAGASAASIGEKAANLAVSIEDTFGPNAPDIAGALGFDTSSFLSGFGGQQQPAWTFITAPEDVSWDIANNAQRVDIFGTNNPPVIAGSRGMRDLTLSNSLVEGFIRNVTVEAKVAALEKLMEYSLNASDGFVSVPVYQVWANEKSYGGPTGYFIIKDVKVKETMRDLTGNTTRAYVDVSLMQVPEYQVNSGRDQASTVTAGGEVKPAVTGPNGQANAAGGGAGGVAGTPANGGSTSSTAKPGAGPGVGTSQPAKNPGLDAIKPAQANERQR